MKPFIFTMAVLFALSSQVCGQGYFSPDREKPRFELSAGYGVRSSDQQFDGSYSHYHTPGKYTYNIETVSGPASMTVKYFLGRKIAVGLAAVYENETGDWLTVINNGGNDDYTTKSIGWFRRKVFTVAPECTFTYKEVANGLVRFYCFLGIGFSYENEVNIYSESYYRSQYYNGVNILGTDLQFDNNRTHFNMQLSQGIRFGRRFGCYIEAGIGYKGLFSAGLTWKI